MNESPACIGRHNLRSFKFKNNMEVEKEAFGMKIQGCVLERGEGGRVVLGVLFRHILSKYIITIDFKHKSNI